MTIKELIEKLKALPQNTTVLIKGSGSNAEKVKKVDSGTYHPNTKEFIPVGSDEEDVANSILLG